MPLPDLCAWCLFDDIRRGLVAIDAAPVGEPLPADALARMTTCADGLAGWHLSGAPAWSPDAVSAALAPLGRRRGVGPASFVWEPGLEPPPDDTHPMSFSRITIDPAIMAGAACITGTRIPVRLVADLAASGWSVVDILSDYPDLTGADVEEAVVWQEGMGHLAFPRPADDEDNDGWHDDDGEDGSGEWDVDDR